jgi:hypothetical protein
MMKVFLAAAFLAAISIPASAGGRNGNLPNGSLYVAGQGGVFRASYPHNQGGSSIYDRWGNLNARNPDAFPQSRKHNYRGTVTLVR